MTVHRLSATTISKRWYSLLIEMLIVAERQKDHPVPAASLFLDPASVCCRFSILFTISGHLPRTTVQYQCDIILISSGFKALTPQQKDDAMTTNEKSVKIPSGWMLLPFVIIGFLTAASLIGFFIYGCVNEQPRPWQLISGILTLATSLLLSNGFFTFQPNEATVLTLFGKYIGSARNHGFQWTNPFQTRKKISLRSRNFNSPTMKVNDKRGNPIEIGAVIVWKVQDTAHAVFEVDNYKSFVEVQTESAVRQLASNYAYDDGEEGETTLRSGRDEISKALATRLQERLKNAGVFVEEARLSHLAYSPEIAQAMLRRQQAEAIISARKKIVEGAVSMVEMALKDLTDKKVVELDNERKATMISNLLVVLCSESEAKPVLNTGTLYN